MSNCQMPQGHPTHCGCLPEGTEQVSSAWLAQLREEYRQYADGCADLIAKLAAEQKHTFELAKELKKVKADRKACWEEFKALRRSADETEKYLRAELESIRKEQAITRRVVDRIGQLCTTPHESKGRFIRRVQSVIEWEAQALSAEASP